MGNIVLLDDLTINKIAAGEVIERPASVIKEMVENSIDAGATSICVEIKNGGISYIKITDNGKGIMPDDMEMAFERHATSKIRSADDLDTVKSMGFRGEALASVASIANVEMISRTDESEEGNKIVVEAGKLLEEEEIGCPIGTTITVTKLFFNTPVRYKFLKKDFTETGYIEDAITRLALINPNIAFKLINSGKVVIQTSGNGDMQSVIYNIYGKDIAESILNVDYTYEDIHITGVVGKPSVARSNRSNQLFFVNKRYIKDKNLSAAIERSFKGMLTIGKYAFAILNIDMDSKKVDVNVHPAKLEVRFQEEQIVFKAMYHAIKDTLLKNDLVTDTEKEEKENDFGSKFVVTPTLFRNNIENTEIKKDEGLKENDNNAIKTLLDLQQKINKEINITKENNEERNILEEISKEKEENKENQIIDKIHELEKVKIENDIPDFNEMYSKTFGAVKKEEDNEKKEQTGELYDDMKLVKSNNKNISIFEKSESYSFSPKYKFIGIVFKTYIIIEMDNEMYILDQHAAHERIMYEKVKENFYSQAEKDSQLMLLPDIVTLTHKEMDIAKENIEMFERAGFILEEFGDNTIKISGTPSILIELNTKELFLETLDEINTVARTAKQEIEEKFIATVACKAAVKAHMALTKEEVDSLMEKLLKLPNPFTCPHGRPTAIKMTKYDIEKKFSRR